MKKLLSAIIVVASAVGASALKAKGHTKTALVTLVAGSIGAAAVLFVSSFAAELETIPVTFSAGDSGYLNVGITAAITTITVSPINKYVNGVKTAGCFDATKGFVLIQDGAGRSEYASYGTKTCASNVTTLTDVRRGLDPTTCTFTAGTGLSFSAGTSIRIINHPCLFNHALYDLNANTLTASGRILSTSTTQTWLTPTNVTTAQRDAFTDTRTGDVIHNTTLGIPQFYDGSSWLSYGTGALINATTAIRGVVSLASSGASFTGSGQGIGGSFNVLPATLTTTSGGLSNGTDAGFIPVLEDTGFLSGTVLGQGPTASTFLKGDQTWATIAQSDLAANISFPTTALVARWQLNESSGNAIDTFASLDLTVQSTPGTDIGISENCAESSTSRDWDSSSDHFDRADSAELSFTSDFSIGVWVKVGAAIASGETRAIASNYNSTSDRGIIFSYADDSGTPYLKLQTSTSTGTTTQKVAKTLAIDQWYYYFVTYNESESAANFYLDGVLVSIEQLGGASALNDTTGNFRLGCTSTDGSTCSTASSWDGAIQDVTVWSAEKTAAEVKAIYNKYVRGCHIPLPTT